MNEQQRSISMMNPSTDNAGAAAAGWGCDFLGAMSIGLQTPHRQDWDWETTSLCLPARHRHRRYDQSEDQKPRILLPSSLGSLPEGFPGGPMAHFGPSSSSSFEPAAFMYSDERPHMLGGSDVNVFDEVLKKEDELELWCGEYQRGARIGLNLGHRTYFSTEDAASVVARMYRRTRAIPPAPRCQAEHCKADLSSAKHYHRRHKVCEYHSKATVVMTAGVQQRFCQQCSRFHVLAEFDEVKRSCRKRLADHNRRRRKPLSNAGVPASSSFQAPICTNTTSTREMREASKRVKTEDGSPMSAIPLPRLTSSNSAVTKCYNKEDVRGGYDDDEHLNSRGGMAEHKGPGWAVKGQYYSGLELALPWLSRSPSHYAGEREEETTEPSSTHSSVDNTLRHHHAPLLSDKAHTVAFQPLTSREWMVGNDTATATGPDAHHKIFSIIDPRIASAEEQSHVSVARHADYLAYRQWLWDSKNDHSKFSHGFRCFVPSVFDDTPAL